MIKRLAIARLSHEGNSFSPVLTGQADFERREWVAGAAARAFYRGSRSELGAVVAFLDARPDWNGTFLRCAAAPPGGPVEGALLGAIRDEILEGLARGLSDGPWDGVYLSLHGAMIGPEAPRADLDLVTVVRAVIGTTPLALSFDLHANLDPALADRAEILLGYKTYPHVDTFETGTKALDLLTRAAEGKIAPVSRVAPVGALLPSFNMRTEQGPMAEMADAARRLEVERGLLDVTPFGGFAYGDVPQAGASVTVCADGDAALAARTAGELATSFRARRGDFLIHLPGPEAALRKALTGGGAGPAAVLEPADNPMSGGIGDSPGLFRALLAARPDMAPATRVAFAFFWDPELVARAQAAGPGGQLDVTLGGRLTGDFGPSVAVRARVARLTEGRFVNQGPMERGLPVDLGPTAVLDVLGIEVIVTGACVSPNDEAYFALHGIELARLDLLCVKAKNHFRAAFARSFTRLVDADTPGPAALDLAKLPFHQVSRAHLPPYTEGS
ncbi:MAG: M81 family metallopeptidase [Alphaproteobacteria bacterium]